MTKQQNVLGKIPPQAIDLEESILGAMMLEKHGAYLGAKLLKSIHFYKEQHQKIFEAITVIQSEGSPVDLLTVMAQLKKAGDLEFVGGALGLSKLTDKVASSANIEYHCKLVVQKFISRETIRISSETTRNAYDDSEDVFDLIDKAISSLHSATTDLLGSNNKQLKDIARELDTQIDGNQKGVLSGVPTGNPAYDALGGGLQKGHMIVIAGRPGMGKTARMCNEIYYQLSNGYAVVIHCLDMPSREVLCRIVSLKANLSPSKVLSKKLSPDELVRVKDALKWATTCQLQLFENKNISSIIIETSMLVAMKKCDIVYLDYLQKCTAGYKSEYDDVSHVSDALKTLAMNLEIPVVPLAQLSRSVETRGGDKKPTLSDLRGSGQIEQDADVIDFMYRPEYYDINIDESGNSLIGKCFYINAKRRGGTPNTTIEMDWNGALNKLTPVDINNFASLPTVTPLTPGNDFDDVPF